MQHAARDELRRALVLDEVSAEPGMVGGRKEVVGDIENRR
jgi:hypothetical protein